MCGISGFVDHRKNTDNVVLEKMNRSMVHRGPDGEGYAFFDGGDASVGIGHRRLSIIDLTSTGSQPQSYLQYHITYNGEIYNYAAIKIELEQKGHQFSTHSDTEVILHAFAEWGKQAVHRFIGMFAFVIYDDAEKKIYACRDRAGVKPLFYYHHQGLFLFGSELKVLMQHPAFEKNIDLDAVAAFMQFGYVPTPNCIFKNTFKLKPGHYLEYNIQSQKISITQYWNVYDAYNKPTLDISFEDALNETEKILLNAFQYRMVSDVPVGVFLSGGYDSTCVTALLQHNNTERIKTFTIGVPDAGLNEAPYAKEIAQRLGTDHTEYFCTQKEALEIVPDLPYYYDEPFADSSAIPTTLVSQIARQKVTVALSADAGDEVFAGYNRYDYVLRYGKKIKSIPGFMRKGAASLMDIVPASSIPVLNKKYLFHNRYEKMKTLLRDPSEINVLMSLTRQMDDVAVSKMFLSEINTLETAFDTSELKQEYYSTLSMMMAMDYQTYLLDDILQKVDRAGMSTSLEGREPFLDHRVIEWAAQLPNEYKYNNGVKKYILREIVHKYIPKQVMDRPKMGFAIPVADWLQSELKPLVDQYFNESFIQQQKIFNNQEIQDMRKSFFEGKQERAEKIWYFLMFQMWYDKWINNN